VPWLLQVGHSVPVICDIDSDISRGRSVRGVDVTGTPPPRHRVGSGIVGVVVWLESPEAANCWQR